MAGSGALILFLHGLGGNRGNWVQQLEFFSRKFKAAAWDARGYGDSEDYDGPLDFEDFSRDVLRVADWFEADRFYLVGLSMGGRIARNVALREPGRVAGLVLANTSPGFDALSPEKVAAFVNERRLLDPAAQARRLISPHAQAGAYEKLVQSLGAVHPGSYLKTLEASVTQDRKAPIEQIHVPTLVVTSDADPLYPQDLARDMARRIPGAELAVIERAGHLSNLEQPGQFNQVVLEFLNRQETSP